MQEEIMRIKQKDFTALDNKLFENLEKADYLNSTLTNLEQFQKFLMNQISIYDSKEKPNQKNQKNIANEGQYVKNQKQIIIQNCQNLKKSILRVIPTDLEQPEQFQSIQKEKEYNFSRVKNNNKFAYSRMVDEPTYSQTNVTSEVQKLKRQVESLRKQLETLEKSYTKNIKSVESQTKAYIIKNVQNVISENSLLKKQIKKLQRQASQKSLKITQLQKLNQQLNKKISSWEQAKSRMNSRCASIEKHLQSSFKTSFQEQDSTFKNYKCFRQKLDLNFTGKLAQSELHIENEAESQTFRESALNISVNKNHFISVQLNRSSNPDIPRPLRRQSISNSLTKDTSQTNQVLRQSIKSQNAQNTMNESLNKKKSNHDMTRKTKSNFFKSNPQEPNQRNNRQNIMTISQTTANVMKIKGLQQKRQPSKQKLKIFSFI